MTSWTSVNWFWPKLTDPKVAVWAAREGAVAALAVAVLCLLDARSEALFLAAAALFLVLAIAIWRLSLLAAMVGFLLCGANLLAGLLFSLEMSAEDYDGFSKLLWIINGLLTLAFINSVRGITAHRTALTRVTPPAAPPSDPPA